MKRLCAEIAIVATAITLMERISTMQNDSRVVLGRRWSTWTTLRGTQFAQVSRAMRL
jgi:hypothetical protein